MQCISYKNTEIKSARSKSFKFVLSVLFCLCTLDVELKILGRPCSKTQTLSDQLSACHPFVEGALSHDGHSTSGQRSSNQT